MVINQKRNQIGILGVHVAHAALDLFVSVFIIAKLLSTTDGNITKVALFYLVLFGAIALFYTIFSYVVKRYSRVWCVRASTLALVGSIVLILFLKDSLATYYLLFALCYGIAEGIYWSSIHLFTTEQMGGRQMRTYLTWFYVLMAATRIIFPVTLGAVIRFVSFTVAAFIAAGIGIVLVLWSLFLREQSSTLSHNMSMKNFFTTIRDKNLSGKMWHNFGIQFVAMLFSCTSICLTILVVLVYGDNLELGVLTSIFAGASIASLTAYRLIRNRRARRICLWIASVLPALSAIGLLFGVSATSVIAIQIGATIFGVIPRMEFDRQRMNIMKDSGLEHLNAESMVFCEFAFAIGRFVVMSLMVLTFTLSGVTGFAILVFTLTTMVLPSTYLFRRFRRTYSQTTIATHIEVPQS
jgi:YQGE family putative transporter